MQFKPATYILILFIAGLLILSCGNTGNKAPKYTVYASYKDTLNSEAQYVLVLPERVSESDLKVIQQEFKESIGDTLYMFDYIYVTFYINKFTSMRQWAFGELYPGDSIKINGTTKEFFDKQVEKVNNDKRGVIGGWIMEGGGNILTILYKDNNRYFLDQKLVDDYFTNGLLSYGDTIEVTVEKADTVWLIDTKNKNDERVKRQKNQKSLYVSKSGQMGVYSPDDTLIQNMAIFEKLKYNPGKLK